METNKSDNKSNEPKATSFSQTFFHATKADLKIGDFIEVGFNSNYGQRKNAKYTFLTATWDAAIWGAELAFREGDERIYLVEPTGSIENDPDLTDKKFPGNPTQSYRSLHPFRSCLDSGKNFIANLINSCRWVTWNYHTPSYSLSGDKILNHNMLISKYLMFYNNRKLLIFSILIF